jgi:hypothetical protein
MVRAETRNSTNQLVSKETENGEKEGARFRPFLLSMKQVDRSEILNVRLQRVQGGEHPRPFFRPLATCSFGRVPVFPDQISRPIFPKWLCVW